MKKVDRITIDPTICHGKPTIRGSRMLVSTVLELLSAGMTHEEILADHDGLADRPKAASTDTADVGLHAIYMNFHQLMN